MRRCVTTLVLLTAACFPTAEASQTPTDSGGSGSTSAAPVSKRPFVVNWAPTERTALETQARDGAVVLAWDRATGEADVLGRCRIVSDPYRFVGSSHAQQTMKTTTELDLGANFPFSGPVNLGAKLEQYGEINVEYHTVGEYKLDVDAVHIDDLEGSCAGATHVVVALSVGAFKLFAGKALSAQVSAEVPMTAGASGGGSKTSEGLDQGGDPAKCDEATRSAEEPVDGCDSVLAIELMAIDHDSPFVAGERWEGNYECNDRKATAFFVVDDVREDGSVQVTLEFDYADVQGAWVAQGKPDDKGALLLEFQEWKDQPRGFIPVAFSGVVDPGRGEFAGDVTEDECEGFTFIRR